LSPESLIGSLGEPDWSLHGYLYSVARRVRSGNDIIADLSLNFSIPDIIEVVILLLFVHRGMACLGFA
jgi:hypothetical protein